MSAHFVTSSNVWNKSNVSSHLVERQRVHDENEMKKKENDMKKKDQKEHEQNMKIFQKQCEERYILHNKLLSWLISIGNHANSVGFKIPTCLYGSILINKTKIIKSVHEKLVPTSQIIPDLLSIVLDYTDFFNESKDVFDEKVQSIDGQNFGIGTIKTRCGYYHAHGNCGHIRDPFARLYDPKEDCINTLAHVIYTDVGRLVVCYKYQTITMSGCMMGFVKPGHIEFDYNRHVKKSCMTGRWINFELVTYVIDDFHETDFVHF
jgi:hypothetical protein